LADHLSEPLQRAQIDFHTAVERTPRSGVVAGDRLAGTGAIGRDARSRHAIAFQIRGDAACTPVGEVLVQLQRTGAIGVADDIDAILVEFLEHQYQRIQGGVEAAGDVRRVAGEGDVARHDQGQVVAVTLDLYASALQLQAQLVLMGSNVLPVTAGCRATDRRADQRALGALLLARSGRTDDRTADGADTTVDARLAGLSLTGIGVGRATDQQRDTRSEGG